MQEKFARFLWWQMVKLCFYSATDISRFSSSMLLLYWQLGCAALTFFIKALVEKRLKSCHKSSIMVIYWGLFVLVQNSYVRLIFNFLHFKATFKVWTLIWYVQIVLLQDCFKQSWNLSKAPNIPITISHISNSTILKVV